MAVDWPGGTYSAPGMSGSRSGGMAMMQGSKAIPITEAQNDYLHEVASRLRAAGIRTEVDDSDDRMQKKIRNAQRQKVPFMVLAGATDAEAGAVSFRYRDGGQRNGIPVAQAVAEIAGVVAGRSNRSPAAEDFGPPASGEAGVRAAPVGAAGE